MRLLRVELTRLRWRRAVILLLACCFLVPALIWAGLAWNTRPYSADELDQLRADAETMHAAQISDCVAHPENYFPPKPHLSTKKIERRCEKLMTFDSDAIYLDREALSPAQERHGTGFAVITILAALAMLVGTTFAGHDWNSGSMSNQLLFEPRRLRVWAAKATVIFVVGLVTSVAVLAAYWGAIWWLANSRDIAVSAHAWELIRNSAGRGALLTALAGLGGYALTMLFRSTVASLGILFAVAVGGSLVMVAVLGDGAERWLLPSNVSAVVNNGYDYYSGNPQGCFTGTEDACTQMAHLSLADGATYLGVLLAVAVVLSLWSFRRRDVP
jgi:ABC-2 type transport system permease protein